MSFEIPKMVNKQGGQIRIFMPRYGNINERRHQLHEVIRLSGLNLVIDDLDMPLIVKVASIQKREFKFILLTMRNTLKENLLFLTRRESYSKITMKGLYFLPKEY